MNYPLISIVIPAYKNINYLKILLNSIAVQTYKNFEVIITDDSPSDELQPLIETYKCQFLIIYKKNNVTLGSPQNWNEGIKFANSQWIKIMHNDDWFTSATSLQIFANYITANPTIQFFYSANNNVHNNGKIVKKANNWLSVLLLKKSPYNLLRANSIGNPSCTMYKKDAAIIYNPTLKWVVDFEFYIHYILKHKNTKYINDILINTGVHEGQITKACQKNIEIELPESLYILENFGQNILRNIFVYDYYWRLIRRFEINKIQQILPYYAFKQPQIEKKIAGIINFQSYFPIKLLNIGLISKILMVSKYIFS